MTFVRRCLPLVVPLLTLVSCERAAPSGARYLALGDSYTIGESVAEPDRWPVQLVKALRTRNVELADPQIIARTGWTTDDLTAAIDDVKPRGPFALVSLLIGVNDQFGGRAPDDFRPRFTALLDRAIAAAGGDPRHVIVLSIPDWGVTPFGQANGAERARAIGSEIDAFNVVCKKTCEEKGVAYVDITPISRDAATDPKLVAGDGLHPSGSMYARWCEAAMPKVFEMCSRTADAGQR